MSAIAGLFSTNGHPDRQRLERIHRAMAHRGRGHEWIEVGGGLGLAARGWPWEASGRAVANGCSLLTDARLDNRSELAEKLGVDASALSDADLILHAWARWGRACLERLEGDFSFALWDSAQRLLFCARDPLGIRPFFYRWDGHSLAWASEVKALAADPDYAPAPDEVMVGEYILGWSDFPDTSATFYRNIRQLPAGHWLAAENDALKVQRYWDIDPADEGFFRRSFEKNAGEFGELFQHAVRQRLERAERLGIMISGGLDSTSVGSVAEHLRRRGAVVPSTVYTSFYTDAPGGDERAYAGEFARTYGCEIEFHRTEQFRILDGIEQAADLKENPLLDLGWSVIRPWGAELRARSCQAVLSGFGGDNIFPSANPGYAADIWRRRGAEAGWGAARQLAAEFGDPPGRVLAATLRLLIPAGVKRLGKRLLGRELPPWVRRDFARRSGLLDRLRNPPKLQRGFSSLSQEWDYQHLNCGRFGLQVSFFDRFGAVHGVEFRHPFLYPPLVRLTVLTPPEQKIFGRETKRLLRHSMAGILPEGVRQRRDKGTPDPFLLSWIRQNDCQRWRRLAATLGPAREYLDPGEVQAQLERMLRGEDLLLKPVWSLLALELWLRYNFGAGQG